MFSLEYPPSFFLTYYAHFSKFNLRIFSPYYLSYPEVNLISYFSLHPHCPAPDLAVINAHPACSGQTDGACCMDLKQIVHCLNTFSVEASAACTGPRVGWGPHVEQGFEVKPVSVQVPAVLPDVWPMSDDVTACI